MPYQVGRTSCDTVVVARASYTFKAADRVGPCDRFYAHLAPERNKKDSASAPVSCLARVTCCGSRVARVHHM